MPSTIISFIVIALLCALFLWVLGQFSTLDATIVRFIRIAVLLVLSLLLLNLVLVLLTGKPIAGYLH
jgi:hypothetical protein